MVWYRNGNSTLERQRLDAEMSGRILLVADHSTDPAVRLPAPQQAASEVESD